MSPSTRTVNVDVDLKDGDAVQLDELTNSLRNELLQLDVAAVDRRYAGKPPPGARAVEIAALGALLVKLAATPELLGIVVHTIQSWIGGHADRTVRLKLGGDQLEVKGVTSAQQQQLIDDWIARHSTN
jgi:hypothetical protein